MFFTTLKSLFIFESIIQILYPFSSKTKDVWLPINPHPPVTKMVGIQITNFSCDILRYFLAINKKVLINEQQYDIFLLH